MTRIRDTRPRRGLGNTSVDPPFSGGFVPIYTGGEQHWLWSDWWRKDTKQKDELDSRRRSQAWRATTRGTSCVLKHFVLAEQTQSSGGTEVHLRYNSQSERMDGFGTIQWNGSRNTSLNLFWYIQYISMLTMELQGKCMLQWLVRDTNLCSSDRFSSVSASSWGQSPEKLEWWQMSHLSTEILYWGSSSLSVVCFP